MIYWISEFSCSLILVSASVPKTPYWLGSKKMKSVTSHVINKSKRQFEMSSFTVIYIHIYSAHHRFFLSSRASKPHGKSATLLIIATYSYCRQHPTAPRTITWPTTAHRMQTSRGLPFAPVGAAQKQWERKVKSLNKEVYMSSKNTNMHTPRLLPLSDWKGVVLLSQHQTALTENEHKVSSAFHSASIKASWCGTGLFGMSRYRQKK